MRFSRARSSPALARLESFFSSRCVSSFCLPSRLIVSAFRAPAPSKKPPRNQMSPSLFFTFLRELLFSVSCTRVCRKAASLKASAS